MPIVLFGVINEAIWRKRLCVRRNEATKWDIQRPNNCGSLILGAARYIISCSWCHWTGTPLDGVKSSIFVHVCPRIVFLKRRSLVKFPVNITIFFAQFLICLTEILSFGYGVKILFPCSNKLSKLFMAVKIDHDKWYKGRDSTLAFAGGSLVWKGY